MGTKVDTYTDLLETNEYGITYPLYQGLKLSPDLVQQYKDEWNINTNCANECIACQIGCIEKYRNHKSVVQDKKSPWQIQCKFIPKTYDIPARLAKRMTPRQAHLLRCARDPVAWAKHFLGWEARSYQEMTLKCSAKRTVHRWGRRCLAEGTMVATPSGSVAIEKIRAGDTVYSEDCVPIKVISTFDQGPQEVYDLEDGGSVIASCTLDHKWLVENKNTKELLVLPTKEISSEYGIVRKNPSDTSVSVSLKRRGIVNTYDIEVDSLSSLYLLSTGYVTHNSGKCLVSTGYLNTSQGSVTAAEALSLYQNSTKFSIQVYNETTHTLESTNDLAFWDNGDKQSYRILTSGGRKEDVTYNHPFLVWKSDALEPEWIEAESIKRGDIVAIPQKTYGFGKEHLNPDIAALIGYMVGDGSCTNRKVAFTNIDQSCIDEWTSIVLRLGATHVGRDKDTYIAYGCTKHDKRVPNLVLELLKEHEAWGKKSIHKDVPKIILRSDKETVATFLNRLLVCDGWICPKKTGKTDSIEIGYCSSSKLLIDGVSSLLHKFGILHEIQYGKKTNYKNNTSNAIYINDINSIKIFAEEIGIGYKSEKLEKLVAKYYSDRAELRPGRPSRKDILPVGILNLVRHEQAFLGISNRQLSGGHTSGVLSQNKHFIGRSKIFQYQESLNSKKIDKYLNKDILWDKVKVVSDLGIQPTVGLETRPCHTISNEIITHNTEQCAVEILFYTLTTKLDMGTNSDGETITSGPITMIVTPYLSQIQNVFEKLDALLKRNPELLACRTRYVKSPFYQMEFVGGAKIKGFTTGSKSKGEGATLRGQGANKIYLDESDYLGEGDYKAIMPILHEDVDRSIIASSTPTGKREQFFDWCFDSPMWKEFFFPATFLNHWETIKDEVTSSTSYGEFMLEYMAEFVAQDIGVFQPDYIINAYTIPPYEYGNVPGLNKGWTISIGVDWNSNAGTEMVVTAMDNKQHIWVVECANVIKQGWTQLAAVEKLLELVRKYRPKFVYADKGFGSTQAEIIKKYSQQIRMTKPEDPVSMLYDNFVSYDFGSKIEVRDPVDGNLIKKPAKDWLVQNCVRRFEEGRIHIPIQEELLKKQLHNYVIDRTSLAGVPVYGQNNVRIGDHRLDAFMLAVLAYKMEMTEFSVGSNIITKILYAGQPGENYKETKQKENLPFAADIRYPEGYMKYNTNSEADKSRPQGRGFKGPSREDTLIPGSTLKEMRPGFMSDTEHLKKGKSMDVLSRPGFQSGRGSSLGRPSGRGGF